MVAVQHSVPERHLDVRVRSAVPGDMAFVLDTWRKSWHLSTENSRLSGRQYHPLFDALVRRGVLGQEDAHAIVACDRTAPDTILAWVCFTPGTPTLHFAYTRMEYRHRGLFSVLLAAMGVHEGGGLAYTFRPQEYRHRADKRALRLEDSMLAALARHRIVAQHVDAEAFLGRSH